MSRKTLVVGLSAVLAAAVIAVPATLIRSNNQDESAAPPSSSSAGTRLGAASVEDVSVTQQEQLQAWAPVGFGTASQVEYYEDVPIMAKNSTVVVAAKVVRSYPTRVVGGEGSDGDPGLQFYGLELQVSKVLAGQLWNEADTQGKVAVEAMGKPADNASLDGVFFLVHKLDRLYPGAPASDNRREDAPKGEERYYRFISTQGLLVRGENGNPVFPLGEENQAIEKSVAGLTYDEVVSRIP